MGFYIWFLAELYIFEKMVGKRMGIMFEYYLRDKTIFLSIIVCMYYAMNVTVNT